MNMTRDNRRHIRLKKAELQKKVRKGLLPKQALHPPEFRVIVNSFNEGDLSYFMDGELVSQQFYLDEMKRLDFNPLEQKMDIKGFRNPNNEQ